MSVGESFIAGGGLDEQRRKATQVRAQCVDDGVVGGMSGQIGVGEPTCLVEGDEIVLAVVVQAEVQPGAQQYRGTRQGQAAGPQRE